MVYNVSGRPTCKGRERRLGVLGPSVTGEAACPSEVYSCTSSLSFLWWTTRVQSAAASGSCTFYNSSIFALRLTHLCTLVTNTSTSMRRFHFFQLRQRIDWDFRLTFNSCGIPLFPWNFKGTCADRGLPSKTDYSARLVTSNFSAILTEASLDFTQL